MRRIALLVATFGLLVSTSARADKPNAIVAPALSSLEVEQQLLAKALQHVKDEDEKGAHDVLEAVVAAPAFSQLSDELRHWAFYLLGLTAQDLGDHKAGLAYARKAAAMKEATGADWKLLLNAATAQQDAANEADALITIAQRWPTTLDQYRDRYYVNLCVRLKSNDPTRRAAFLNALADANWSPTDRFDHGSLIWLWLTEARLKADDIPGAKAAAEKITSDNDVLVMQSDKLFDPVTTADPERFRPTEVANRRLTDLRNAAAAAPDRIEGPFQIAVQLMTLERNEEALELMDQTLRIASPMDGSKTPYTDVDDFLIWVMDTRSRLLKRLGRYDEAVAQEKKVSQYAEDGGLNISQLLNLGDLLVKVGRPREAFDLLQDADARNMSAYGRMVLMYVRGCAAEQLHETGETRKALDYLRSHSADNVGALSDALACIGDEEGMAKVLVRELNDPDQRDSVLMAFQDFDQAAGVTQQEQLWKQRFQAAAGRAEVQAAVQSVGHIHKYAMNAPLN